MGYSYKDNEKNGEIMQKKQEKRIYAEMQK